MFCKYLEHTLSVMVANILILALQFSSVQSLSHVRLLATP